MGIAFDRENVEVAVYSQRVPLVRYFVFFLCCALLATACFSVSLYFASGLPFVRPSPLPAMMIFAQIIMAIISILMVLILILMYSLTIFTGRRLISKQPVLLATEQGIHLRDLPYAGDIFFFWHQVASLSVVSVPQTFFRSTDYLCLYPNNPTELFSRFRPWRRFLVKRTSQSTGTPIHVPSWFLAEPVGEVLLQIQKNFQAKL